MKPDSKHIFYEHIVHGETTRKQLTWYWQIAIGLQDVDQLKPSPYLLEPRNSILRRNLTLPLLKNASRIITGKVKDKTIVQ